MSSSQSRSWWALVRDPDEPAGTSLRLHVGLGGALPCYTPLASGLPPHPLGVSLPAYFSFLRSWVCGPGSCHSLQSLHAGLGALELWGVIPA